MADMAVGPLRIIRVEVLESANVSDTVVAPGGHDAKCQNRTNRDTDYLSTGCDVATQLLARRTGSGPPLTQ
jgi:hypothetical protein